MKALVFHGPRDLMYSDVPEPVPAPGEAVVSVDAAGVCGSEMESYLGLSSKRRGPLILGHELAGRLVSGGPWGPGTRVAINPLAPCGACAVCTRGRSHLCPDRTLLSLHRDGGHAERVAVRADLLRRVPDGLSATDAALAEPAATALNAVSDVRDVDGGAVLIIGCGAIGLLAVQWVMNSAKRVVAIDVVGARKRLALAAGAATDLPAGHGWADAVIDTVGTPATRQLAVDAVCPGGSIRLVGLRERVGVFDFGPVIAAEVTLQGVYAYSPEQFDTALHALADGTLTVAPFTDVFPLADGAHVFETLAEHPDRLVKAVLVP